MAPRSHTSPEQSSAIDAESAAKAAAASEERVAHTASLDPALESLHLEKVIDQDNWDSKDSPDFREKTLASHYRLVGSAHLRTESESGLSDTSSMDVVPRSAVLSFSPSSSRPPSLGSYPSVRSTPSVRTSKASIVIRQTVLEEDADGVLRAPPGGNPVGKLVCCFHFLGCAAGFDDLEQWNTHCESHLRGNLPREVHCPFVCDWAVKCGSGREAWQQRNDHIDEDHTEHEKVDTKKRPAASLIDHLWRHNIIDTVEKKELQANGRIVKGDFSMPAGSARHRRQTRRRQ